MTMAPKFGTSGLRGLVSDLTEDLVTGYIRAFLAACPIGGGVYVGWDLRESSPKIADMVIQEIAAQGQPVWVAGAVPTPALALAAGAAGCGAVMITGSHIPADRNGLKFYTPAGEILKADETRITAARATADGQAARDPGAAGAVTQTDVLGAYLDRLITGLGQGALSGLRIGVYQHSSVARDVMVQAVEALGGVAIPLARSDHFIPVDTEAVDPETQTLLAGWCRDHRLDAVVSTDGDADRPMLADARGQIIPGDILGALSAQALGAEHIVTPVSSNTMVQAMGFDTVTRTRIGSPFVIAAMQETGGKVAGYEANGGFLLGFAAQGPLTLGPLTLGPLAQGALTVPPGQDSGAAMSPLMTRDSLVPMLTPLVIARTRGQTLADLVAALPPRFTAADRLQGIAPEISGAFLTRLCQDPAARAAFFDTGMAETDLDLTDGLRVSFGPKDQHDIVHLRPSGNAPEFRCYTEANSPARAASLLAIHLARLTDALGGPAEGSVSAGAE